MSATDADKTRRLAKLAMKSKTFGEFVSKAQRFPLFFGYPGRGSMLEWKAFFEARKALTTARL
jgi:hypothetical protein